MRAFLKNVGLILGASIASITLTPAYVYGACFVLAYATDGHAVVNHPVLDLDEDGILDADDQVILLREWTWSKEANRAWVDATLVGGEQHFPVITIVLNDKPFVAMSRDEAEAILGTY